MPSKPLYQPWNEEDFSADVDVQTMNSWQKWIYRTLCQKAFVCSTRPYLPNDDELLWKLSGCPSKVFWDQQKRRVIGMFTPMLIDGVKVLSRSRLVADWNNIQKIRKTNQVNAQKRWLSEGGQKDHKTQDGCDRIAVACDGNAVACDRIASKEVSKEINSNPAQKPRASPEITKEQEKELVDRHKVEARSRRLAEENEVRQAIYVGSGPQLVKESVEPVSYGANEPIISRKELYRRALDKIDSAQRAIRDHRTLAHVRAKAEAVLAEAKADIEKYRPGKALAVGAD